MRKNSRRFRAPSPALAVACLALAVALSGAGYAAVTLPRNSVGTAQLKKNAVSSAKVKDGSLQSRDFRAGQLPAGPKGDRGDPGPPGPPNPNAVNSDLLDNLDSTAFVQGNGNVLHGAQAIPLDGFVTFLTVPGFFQLEYVCPNPPDLTGILRFSNGSSDALNVFHDSGTDNPTYVPLSGLASFSLPGASSGDSWVIQVQGALGVAVVNVASVHRPGDCYAQAIATWSH